MSDLEVLCGPLVAGGDALVRREGHKTMFVEGGLPDERVAVEIVKERKDLVNARVTEVLEPSAARVEPAVLLPTDAGGAEWQHIEPTAQHEFKAQIVTDALRRIAKLETPPVRTGTAVDPRGYRTTMRFAVQGGRLAMRRRHTNELITIEHCGIAHPRMQELFSYDFGNATEVTLRVSDTTGQRMAWITGEDDAKLPDDVMITTNGRNATITEEVAGRRWQVSAASFFQSGRQAANLLAEAVNQAVPDEAGWIIDAYSGVGVLGGVAAEERDAQLTSVEQAKSSVIDARANLADLAAEVIEAEVATVSLASQSPPDAVIADPARSGLGPSASKTLADLGAFTFVLVSCDPASLARDVTLLAEYGYDLRTVEVLDLFPHTAQVETVSTFRLR